MSRIGNKSITLPKEVEVKIENENTVTVKGPKGTLTAKLNADMKIKVDNGTLTVERPSDEANYKALHGLTRTLINNMVIGVTEGYQKTLEINGVGYKAQKQGKKLVLSLGYSHPVEMEEPNGITFEVPSQDKVIIKGIDKQLVGAIAAEVKTKRPPEPYKGKGIKYEGEVIKRKEGKTGAKK
jgi:large subunit ribosomal protein L6